MSVRIMADVFEDADCSGNDRVVLLVLADHASDDGTGAYPAQATIARKARVTDRTVRSCLKRLVAEGYIEAVKKRESGVIEYRVLPLHKGAEKPSGRKQASDKPSPSSSSLGEKDREDGSPEAGVRPEDSAPGLYADFLRISGRRERKPGDDDLRVIRDALKAGTPDELRTCFEACAASDWHNKRGQFEKRKGGKHNTLSSILRPRKGGATQRDRIEMWLEMRSEQQSADGDGTMKRRFTRA